MKVSKDLIYKNSNKGLKHFILPYVITCGSLFYLYNRIYKNDINE